MSNLRPRATRSLALAFAIPAAALALAGTAAAADPEPEFGGSFTSDYTCSNGSTFSLETFVGESTPGLPPGQAATVHTSTTFLASRNTYLSSWDGKSSFGSEWRQPTIRLSAVPGTVTGTSTDAVTLAGGQTFTLPAVGDAGHPIRPDAPITDRIGPFTRTGIALGTVTTTAGGSVTISHGPVDLHVSGNGQQSTVDGLAAPGFREVDIRCTPGAGSTHRTIPVEDPPSPRSTVVTTPYECTGTQRRFPLVVTSRVKAGTLAVGQPLLLSVSSTIGTTNAAFAGTGSNYVRPRAVWFLPEVRLTVSGTTVDSVVATPPALADVPGDTGSDLTTVYRYDNPSVEDAGVVTGHAVQVAGAPFDLSYYVHASSAVDGMPVDFLRDLAHCLPLGGALPGTLTDEPDTGQIGAALSGSATITNAFSRGKLPITGTFAASVGTDGSLAGSLALNPGTLDLKALGIIPVTAAATFKPQAAGLVTGTLKGDSLHVTSDYRLLLKSVRLFGLALQTSTACGAQTTVTLDSATGFTAAGLGPVKGSVAIGALTSCGSFTPLLTALVQGRGTFATTLTKG